MSAITNFVFLRTQQIVHQRVFRKGWANLVAGNCNASWVNDVLQDAPVPTRRVRVPQPAAQFRGCLRCRYWSTAPQSVHPISVHPIVRTAAHGCPVEQSSTLTFVDPILSLFDRESFSDFSSPGVKVIGSARPECYGCLS
jgi:hypothetical protein